MKQTKIHGNPIIQRDYEEGYTAKRPDCRKAQMFCWAVLECIKKLLCPLSSRASSGAAAVNGVFLRRHPAVSAKRALRRDCLAYVGATNSPIAWVSPAMHVYMQPASPFCCWLWSQLLEQHQGGRKCWQFPPVSLCPKGPLRTPL